MGWNGIAYDSVSRDIAVTRQEPELAITLTAVPSVFIPDGTQNTTISFTLSKDAKMTTYYLEIMV